MAAIGPQGLPTCYVRGLPTPPRCLVMGILNVTPDSFSDGGRYLATAAAVDHGLRLVAEGADLVDVGGESTRPGASRTTAADEQQRVLPVIRELARLGVRPTVDTMRASTAQRAVEAGAVAVNDVSGGLADPDMHRVVAAAGVPYLLMHWRAHSREMQRWARYDDVVRDVRDELARQVERALAAGIPPERIAVDPGLGFAKDADQTWRLLAHLERLHVLGLPVLVGASRKRFLTDGAERAGMLDDAQGDAQGDTRGDADRDALTAAVTARVAADGAWCVRVHHPAGSLAAALVAARCGAAVRRPIPGRRRAGAVGVAEAAS